MRSRQDIWLERVAAILVAPGAIAAVSVLIAWMSRSV
jgi:hypothetical protein